MATVDEPRCRRRWPWIALAVVLLVVAVFAAIAIPRWLTEIQRGKRKRTMGDIRSIAAAVEAYAADHAGCPWFAGRPGDEMSELGALASGLDAYAQAHRAYPAVPDGPAHEVLTPVLVPTYIERVSAGEPWDYPLEYYSWRDERGQSHYQIICRGADRLPPTGSGRYFGPGGVITHCANDDLVVQDGEFWVRAEGRQDQCP